MSLVANSDTVTAVSLVPDRPSASYVGGDVVTGHCIVTVNGTVSFDCIEIKLIGKAKVELPVNSSSNSVNKDNGFNKYVKELNVLETIYKPSTVYTQSATLTTGKHDIGFSFIIPPNVPSSLDSTLGFIRYKVKAKAGSEKAELVISVITPPSIPPSELMVPIIENKSKNVGLINGKPVLLHCELPRTGFTLGTTIPIKCTVNNQTNKTIVLKGALRQEISFRAHEEERSITNKLSSVRGATIDPKSDLTYELKVSVPINLPIVHNTCPIIMIKYLVTAKLAIPAAFDLRLNIPVVLTNSPMNEIAQQ